MSGGRLLPAAECRYIDDDRDEWRLAMFFFNGIDSLDLINCPSLHTMASQNQRHFVDPQVYDMSRALVGENTRWANQPGEWKPTNTTPPFYGRLSSAETIVAFPNRTRGEPVLWLQFTTVANFCRFYENWMAFFNRPLMLDEPMRNSIEAYEVLKSRNEENNQ